MIDLPIIPKLQRWPRFAMTIANTEFAVALALCLIAFSLALNLIFRFPDFGAVIEQYNQF